MDSRYNVLFAVIAPRDVSFFAGVADSLKTNYGLKSAFLTFYQPGDRYLNSKGHAVFSPHTTLNFKEEHITSKKVAEIENKYDIKSIRDLLLHEKLTFGRFDEDRLLAKLIEYDRYFSSLLRDNKIDNVVQELGGFIAQMSLYYNCMAYKVRHIFIEPAMFKGRLFFNVNSRDVQLSRQDHYDEEVVSKVRRYVDLYKGNKTIVVPEKDRHNFVRAGLRKILTARNIKRLCGKLYYKYIRHQKEEFDAISNHIKRHLMMCLRHLLLKRFYCKPDYTKPYLYFPLHVPLDFQLTVRENRCLDQLSLVRCMGDILPFGWRLYIKEHPASIGGYEFRAMKKILRNQSIKLICPDTNSYDLIASAKGVVTINSKVGAETLMQGKKVIVLGNPYYALAKGAVTLKSVDDLAKIISYDGNGVSEVDYDFLYNVYCNSFGGELYNNEKNNIENFAYSLTKHLSSLV